MCPCVGSMSFRRGNAFNAYGIVHEFYFNATRVGRYFMSLYFCRWIEEDTVKHTHKHYQSSRKEMVLTIIKSLSARKSFGEFQGG